MTPGETRPEPGDLTAATGRTLLSLRAAAGRWSGEHRAADARQLADAAPALLDFVDRLRAELADARDALPDYARTHMGESGTLEDGIAGASLIHRAEVDGLTEALADARHAIETTRSAALREALDTVTAQQATDSADGYVRCGSWRRHGETGTCHHAEACAAHWRTLTALRRLLPPEVTP